MSNSHTHVEGETRETCRVCTPGTDRVELTDAEREALLFGFGIRFYENADHTRFAQGVAAVESIVAARLSTLAADRDQWRKFADRRTEEVDSARAELAAANTRCAELENRFYDARRQRDDLSLSRLNVLRQAEEAWAERDALQATLDRVTALADEADRSERHINGYGYVLLRDLRAALTPEGKPQ